MKSSGPNAVGIEQPRLERSIFNAEIQAAVKAELEMIVAGPSFAHSNRCKRFLKYVVFQTLSGHGGELKERTIGVNVFDRANDYDTGEDSVVRVTSNEVRKRIGQFYRESHIDHPIQIELPRGTYVPEFRICATRRSNDILEVLERENGHAKASLVVKTDSTTTENSDGNVNGQGPVAITEVPRAGRSHRLWAVLLLLLVFLVTVTIAIGLWRSHSRTDFPQVWNAFQSSKVPVLICLGAHDIPVPKEESSSDTDSFNHLVLHREMIPVDDATVITAMASLLGKRGIPFRVAAADQVSLTELRRQPVILIGAADNKWTQRVTQALRYRIKVTYPGSSRDPIASIIDSKQPAGASWTTDFSIPMSAWKSDYGIVARIDDSTTGVPMLVDAGLGNDGSLAASELITSGVIAAHLSNEPQCRGKSNFEAVVETKVIDTRPGPPHVLRLFCW